MPTHPIFQTPPLAQPVPGTRHPKSNLQNAIRVLIIEDDQDAAETLRELLELFGCAVVVARSGMEGIETAPRFGPEVVLCDLRLPGLDGCGVAAALRGLPEMAHTRLIAVSGADGEELRRALEAGFDLHLTKPIDFEALRQLLEVEHVNNRQN